MSWKWISVLVLPLALFILVACDGSPTDPAISLPAIVQLQVGESVFVSSGNLLVRFLEVDQDSRCPTVVVCFWEGEAVVKVELSASGRILGSPLLSTHPNNGSSPNSVRLDEYLLQVLELDPYPATGPLPQSEYRLTLRIERS